jgi:hypothetical protein
MQRLRSVAWARRALREAVPLALAAELDRLVLRFAFLLQVALPPVTFVPTATAEASRVVAWAEAAEAVRARQARASVATSANQRLVVLGPGMRSPHRTFVRVFPGVHRHLDVCMSELRFLHVLLRRYLDVRPRGSAAHPID